MERIKLSDNLSFSKIIHGMWRLESWEYSTEEIIRFIEQCIEMGITTFDHADIYGGYTCEQLFGEALKEKPSLRDQMEIVTKCGISLVSENRPAYSMNHYNTTRKHIIKSVETSLNNFHTNELDVVLIHRPDPLMDPEEVAEAFTLLKKEGKVRHFGVSNFTVPQLNMIQAYLDEPLVTNQIEVSPLCLDHFKNGGMEWLAQHKVKPMIWSPLAGGRLFTDKNEDVSRVRAVMSGIADEHNVDIDTIAYAWLCMHPVGMMPIIGSGKIERVKTAVDALNVTLTREQWYEIFIAGQGYPLP